jgi:hypothetical protein
MVASLRHCASSLIRKKSACHMLGCAAWFW